MNRPYRTSLSSPPPFAQVAALLQHISVARTRGEKEAVLHALTSDRPSVLAFINAHGMNLAWTDPALMAAFLGADVLVRDGVGMALFMRAAGIDPGLNLNGTDFIPEILRMHADRRIALAGTRSPYVEEAGARLESRYGCKIIATIAGFEADEATYSSWAQKHTPDIIVLGMGMPKQERISMRLQTDLSHPCTIINGGAILDFLAGRVVRAPEWVRATRLEWGYRLVREPGRLWRRYLLGNPVHIFHALQFRRWIGRQSPHI